MHSSGNEQMDDYEEVSTVMTPPAAGYDPTVEVEGAATGPRQA